MSKLSKEVQDEVEKLMVHALNADYETVAIELEKKSAVDAVVTAIELTKYLAPYDPYQMEGLIKFLQERGEKK